VRLYSGKIACNTLITEEPYFESFTNDQSELYIYNVIAGTYTVVGV